MGFISFIWSWVVTHGGTGGGSVWGSALNEKHGLMIIGILHVEKLSFYSVIPWMTIMGTYGRAKVRGEILSVMWKDTPVLLLVSWNEMVITGTPMRQNHVNDCVCISYHYWNHYSTVFQNTSVHMLCMSENVLFRVEVLLWSTRPSFVFNPTCGISSEVKFDLVPITWVVAWKFSISHCQFNNQ